MKPRKAQLASLLLHTGAVFALLHLGTAVQNSPRPPHVRLEWYPTKITYDLPKRGDARGGGAGADRTPASKGEPPRAALRQFVLPTTKRPEQMPLLPMEPTIMGVETKPVPVSILGEPAGVAGPPSDGFGGNRGIGQGANDGGVGSDRGPSRGDGPGGHVIGGPATRLSTQPIPIYRVEPEFTEEARKARMQGTVVLLVDIDENGTVTNIRVRTPLGLGLDEKAIEAVRKWRFRPGMRDGVPVRTPALVEVNFHLL